MTEHAQCADKGGGGGSHRSVHVKLLWCTFYCPKPSPNNKSQSGPQSRRGMVRRAPSIMWEYYLMTLIAIRPWPNHVCVKWVPQGFLPWVDSNSIIRLYPPSWACHQLRGKMEKIFPLRVEVLIVLILLLIIKTSQEIIHWLILVSTHVSISKYDAYDSVSMVFL